MALARQETEQFERRSIVAALSWLCDPLRTMENIQIGDLVKLKSGSPRMTVTAIAGNRENCVCAWFDGATMREGNFHPEALKKVDSQASDGGGYEVRQR
jgi:uncharacterized protein YodC (DUF2158 family)